MAFSAQSIEPVGEAPPPRHVAIIMDGNGRWATQHDVKRSVGHKRGAEAVREAITGAVDAGVSYLTLYAFSSENWNRPEAEVSDLMGLLKFYLSQEIKSLHKEGVRLRVIGSRSRLSSEISQMIDRAEAKTSKNKRLTLVIALSYGSREEITEAVRALTKRVSDGALEPEDISEALIDNALFTYDIPDPDLIIRTSGEQRLSNFLLWQCAYSEFLFIETLWPDFTKQDFAAAIASYAERDRRYGVRP